MDSNLTFKVTTSGVEQAQAKFKELGATITKLQVNANGTVTATGKLTSTLEKQSNTTDKVTRSTNNAAKAQGNYFYYITRTTIQSALVNKAFLVLVDSLGKAAKQADLFINFPASMGALGLSTTEASAAFQELRKYVQSVGGDLTKATTSVARFSGVTKNVKAAVAQYAGVSNALIAGGASAEVQASALEQLTQAYSRGVPQLIEWRSLLVAMAPQLEQVAREMGYVNAGALGEALTSGKVVMQDFITTLTALSTGTGPIAQQAIARMQGIEFATNVMKNALVNGLTQIYLTIGRSNIVAFFNVVTKAIQTLATWVVYLINLFISLINFFRRLFGGGEIQQIVGETAQIAPNLEAGTDAAGGLGDSLDDAGKSAKKLNGQLAAFDKMNVLQDKTADSSGKAATPAVGVSAGGLDLDTSKQLLDIFDNLGTAAMKSSRAVNILGTALAALSVGSLISKAVFGKGLFALFGIGIKKLAVFAGGLLVKGFIGIAGAVASALGVSFGLAAAVVVAAIAAIIAVIYLVWRNWKTVSGFIKNVTSSLVDFITARWNAFISFYSTIFRAILSVVTFVTNNIKTSFVNAFNFIRDIVVGYINFVKNVWGTLYDIFAGPLNFLLQLYRGIFIAIVAIVAIGLENIYKAVVGTFTLIYNVLSTVANWVYENVTLPVFNFFVDLWTKVINNAISAFRFIYDNVLRPVALWIYNNVILPVFNFFRDLWNNVINLIINFYARAREVLGGLWFWIKVNVVDRIAQIFSDLWNGVRNGLISAFEGIKFILLGAANIFKTPLNGIIDLLNRVINSVNRLRVPDWVPGLGGRTPGIPQLPRLAQGGVVTSQMTAIIGENGAEAVVPLENNTDWIDMLAAKINSATGSSNQPINLVVQIGEDKVASKIIDLINEKTQMSGRNTILV